MQDVSMLVTNFSAANADIQITIRLQKGHPVLLETLDAHVVRLLVAIAAVSRDLVDRQLASAYLILCSYSFSVPTSPCRSRSSKSSA